MSEAGRAHYDRSDDAPRLARWWIAELLRSNDLDPMVHDAVLLVSELATNAVAHAESGFDLVVTIDRADGADRLHVEVTDAAGGVPQVQWVPAGATSGRGLLIVETLSDAWGVSPKQGGGKAVWFELVDHPGSG